MFASQLTLTNISKYLCQLQTRPCDAQVMEGFTMRKTLDAQPKAKEKTQGTTKRQNRARSEGAEALKESTAPVPSGRRRRGMPATTPAAEEDE